MKSSDYKPFILNSFKKEDDDLYILGIHSHDSDDDFYQEIRIRTQSRIIDHLQHCLEEHIYIDLLPHNTVEIYVGEYYEESVTDGSFVYTLYALQKTEKLNKEIWKPQVHALRRELKAVYQQKLKPYESTRARIVEQFKQIYDHEILKCSTQDFNVLHTSSLFKNLYRLFDDNPSWDSFNKLIDPDFSYHPPTKKDWKEEYTASEQAYSRLNALDPEHYPTIKEHIVSLYKKTFAYMLSSLKYGNKDLNEATFETFFHRIIGMLGKTTE